MISPDQFKQQIITALEQQAALPWLNIPERARTCFLESDIPTRKTEQWKYSSLTPLLINDYFTKQNGIQDYSEKDARSVFSSIENVHRIVFVNGQFEPKLSDCSDLENQGILTLFSNCNHEQQQLVNEHLGSVCKLDQHVFVAANYSGLQEGILIQAAANNKIEQPVHIVYLSTKQNQPANAQTNLLLIAETGAELQLIEQHDSLSEQVNLFHNHASEVVLKVNARLLHLRMQVEDENISHINALHIDLAKDSHYEQHSINFGSLLKRNDIQVNFSGSNSYSRLNGVFLSKHKQHIDNHLDLEHAVPHCNSDTTYKGFITDKSRAVFNGRIHIHKLAQKTEAHLNNKNLLLSKQAELDTKPELEIYADDVKCSHGASIGQLDEKSLFYFQSRGIDRASAEAMLCLGFINEMVELFPNQQVQRLITERLAGFFNDVDKLKSLWSLER